MDAQALETQEKVVFSYLALNQDLTIANSECFAFL